MDPDCGFCLSSDCRGNPGYTDPKCPEHGQAAQAAILGHLDAAVGRLSRQSLCDLVKKAKPEKPERLSGMYQDLLNRKLNGFNDGDAPKIIREKSEHMLHLAQSKRRRARLFEIQTRSNGSKPYSGLSKGQRLVVKHFHDRGLTIVYRAHWSEYDDKKYEVWACW